MPSRLVPVLLVAAAVVFACGPRTHSGEPAARKPASAGTTIVSSLDVHVADRVDFGFHVTNNAAKRLELIFPSGQTHDIVVVDSIGREIWRWSSGRMFTQALQNRVLEGSETLSYAASWSPSAQHGTFIAVAQLRSDNHPLERRVQFTLP